MTGFAKKQCILNNRRYTIEIKTLNSKALDLIVKVPASLRTKELEIRSMLNKLERGKIDVIITEECDKTSAPPLEIMYTTIPMSMAVQAETLCI